MQHTHRIRVKCLQIFGREHTTVVCKKVPYETGYFRSGGATVSFSKKDYALWSWLSSQLRNSAYALLLFTCTCGVPGSNNETVHPYSASSWLASSSQINAGILPQITLRQPHSTSTDVPTTLLNNPQRNSVFTPSQRAFFFLIRKMSLISSCFFFLTPYDILLHKQGIKPAQT